MHALAGHCSEKQNKYKSLKKGENNMGTLIVSLVLIAIVAAVIFSMIKSKRAGRHPSCGGNCAACGGACHACTNKSVKKS